MSSISRRMPSVGELVMSAPAMPMARAHAAGEVHCEPTWKVIPYGRRPRPRASRSRARAWAGPVPNFRESGNTLSASSTVSRTYTALPGACRAILCTSPSESTAKRHSPAAAAAATWAAGLTVLLYSTSRACTPMCSRARSSPSEAISNPAPAAAAVRSTGVDGLHFTA